MDTKFYSEEFNNVAGQLDKTILNKKEIEVAVGIYTDSVFLKMYKTSWANPSQNPLTAPSRIFFSVWINDSAIKQQKIFYNIHALKLRQLKGYTIQSRKFAEIFRDHFKDFEHKWKNVSVKFGPLTLMEGWVEIELENFQDSVLDLANNFLQIEYLIDNTLANFK